MHLTEMQTQRKQNFISDFQRVNHFSYLLICIRIAKREREEKSK